MRKDNMIYVLTLLDKYDIYTSNMWVLRYSRVPINFCIYLIFWNKRITFFNYQKTSTIFFDEQKKKKLQLLNIHT